MTLQLKTLIAAALSAMLFTPLPAVAEQVTCESYEDRRNECSIDTRRGVRIVRTLSKSACVEGYSWGYSRYGVWVKDGCRAVFSNGDSSYGPPRGDDDYYRQRELDREREALERERQRLEDERRRLGDQRYNPPARVAESCPPGFSPSERKCTNDERRRGCKDIRLPSGLGCVKR